MNYDELLKKVAEHVTLLYVEHHGERLAYHNQAHVTRTLDIVKKIAAWHKLDERSHFIVCAAAWFHTIAYLYPGVEDHERKSAEMAGDFLKNLSVDETTVTEVKNAILATRIPQMPVTLTEKILCDAELFNLGTPAFKKYNNRLRKEYETRTGKIKGSEWRARTIALLESHQYHTDYCRLLLDETKAENLEQLKQRQEEETPPDAETASGNISTAKAKDLGQNLDENKQNRPRRPNRGVETMFRVAFASHQKLSALADNKAHIMISVNSIIISVTIGLVLNNFSADSYFIIPTVILLLVNVLTIIFSVLATRPKIHNGFFTKEQLEQKRVNLLFYGSFYKMKHNDYQKAMRGMMENSDFLYDTMIKDIYWQGVVMGRKFRLLHNSYNIFMYGIAIAVIAYVITAIVYS